MHRFRSLSARHHLLLRIGVLLIFAVAVFWLLLLLTIQIDEVAREAHMITDEERISRRAKFDFALNSRQYLNPYLPGSVEYQAYEYGWVAASEHAKGRRQERSILSSGGGVH